MIIFLYGEDSFRSRKLLKEMKGKFNKDVDTEDNSLDVIDGQAASLENITEKINTGSLFARKRMLVIENIFLNKKTTIFEKLANYLPRLENSEEIIIIFRDGDISEKKISKDAKKLFSFLSGQKFSQQFKALTPAGLNNFIKKEAEIYNKKINQSALEELLKRTDGDLWLISQSLKKAALSSDAEIITDKQIIEYVTEKYNEDIFALTDAISANRKAQAVKILEEQYAAGMSEEYLIAMLMRQFKILIKLKEVSQEGQRPESIASSLKIHPFVVKKGLSQIHQFSLANLIQYFNKIVQIDKKNKSEQIDIKSELLLLIAEI